MTTQKESLFLVRVRTLPTGDIEESATRAVQYIADAALPYFALEVLTPAMELSTGFFPEAWRQFRFVWNDAENAFVDNANGVKGGVLKHRNVKGKLVEVTPDIASDYYQ